ncbi:hypothetical protein D3C71_1925960 [compost metagenome]
MMVTDTSVLKHTSRLTVMSGMRKVALLKRQKVQLTYTGTTDKEILMDNITRIEQQPVKINPDHYSEMFGLLSVIAVFCDDERYAKQAEEMIYKIRWSEGR